MSQDINPYQASSILDPTDTISYKKKCAQQFLSGFWLIVCVNFLLFITTYSLIAAVFVFSIASMIIFMVWKQNPLRIKRFLISIYHPSLTGLFSITLLFMLIPYQVVLFVLLLNKNWQDFSHFIKVGSSWVLAFHISLLIFFFVSVLVANLCIMMFEKISCYLSQKKVEANSGQDSEIENIKHL